MGSSKVHVLWRAWDTNMLTACAYSVRYIEYTAFPELLATPSQSCLFQVRRHLAKQLTIAQ